MVMMPIPSRQLLLAFLPILMLPHQFHCDAKPSKMQIRAKRDFMPPDNPGQPCGCASKYAPINCRCTSASGNSGELLCRCDRARIPPINREDSSSGNIISNRAGGPPPMTAQCGGNCRMPAGEPNLFRQGAHQQQHGHGTYGYGGGGGTVPPIHSACHPICHKSCTHSCPSSRSPSTGSIDQQNNNNNFGGGGFSPSEFHHQQHNQPMPSMDSLKGNNNFNCFPSKCRANCLRACSRIFDAQQRQQQQQIRENFVPSNGIENEIDVEPHYQVEMGGQTKLSSPDHGNNNNENIMATGRNGCQCSPSAANVCECQEPCYPICVDTCESNCLQQQMQQSPANQRAQCVQFCHLECQHDCAMEQHQQQRVPARKAVETTMGEGIDNFSGSNNNWQSNDNRMMSSSGSGSLIGNPITICAHKCPRACEQACQSAAQNGEPNSNCVPTCIGLCAQSCARGIQFDAVGLTQQMAVPMPTMALVDIAGGGGAAQMPTNMSINGINGGAEFEQLQHQQQQQQKLNDWGGGGEMATQNYGQNDGQLAEFGNNEMSFPSAAAMAAPPLAMEEAGRQEHTVIAAAPSADGSITGEAAGGMPCAPLCQPECRPECTKRYMEERRGIDDQAQQQYEKMMKNNGMNNGRENDEGKNDGATGSGGNGQKPIGTDQQQQQGQDEQKQQSTKQQRSAASSPSASFVPPHIILDDGVTATAYNDDEEGTNGTTKSRTKSGDENRQKQPKKKQHFNRMPWLRMANETDAWADNNSRIAAELGHPKQQQNNTKTNEVRKKQQKTKEKQSKIKQKVPNAVKNEKQLVVQNGHQHNNKNERQNSNKDDKIRRRANEFFRRRKLLFGGESKVPTKKVPKNGNEKVEKNDPLKAVKREKGGQNAKAQNANAKKWQ